MITLATTTPDMTGTYLNYMWVALAVIVVIGALVWLGWRNRKRRQSAVPAPAEIPSQLLDAAPEVAVEGMVVGTVKSADYLDRVAVHELGVRTDGRVEVHFAPEDEQEPNSEPSPHGVAIFRAGARNWFIPAQQFQAVGTSSGMIGKFVERDGVIIIEWELGEIKVATGFRPRHAAEGRALLDALRRHAPQPPTAQIPKTEPPETEPPAPGEEQPPADSPNP